MFLPTSPNPPRGITCSASAIRAWGLGGDQEAEALQAAAHLRDLVLGRVDQRQPVAAYLVPEQAQRGLDRDRVRLHFEQLVGGFERPIDLACAFEVAVGGGPCLLSHLRTYHVRV